MKYLHIISLILLIAAGISAQPTIEIGPVPLTLQTLTVLLTGALLSSQVKMSRGRTLLIDVGGILGMLAGGLIATGTNDEEGAGIAMIIGTSLGLGVAAVASTKWDKSAPVQVAPAVIPGPNQSTAYGVTAGLTF